MTQRHLVRSIGYALLASLAACTTPNPIRHRDASVDASPPADALVGPVCTANEALRCAGPNLVRCNAEGTAEVNQSCSDGCNSAQKLCNAKQIPVGILWRRDDTGQAAIWNFTDKGLDPYSGGEISTILSSAEWTIRGTGLFNEDGHGDILWQHLSTRQTKIWFMDHGTKLGEMDESAPDPGWTFRGIGDFDGDTRSDILWRNGSGKLAISLRGVTWTDVSASLDTAWQVEAVGDFDGDAHSDILWRNSNGRVEIWYMNGTARIRSSSPGGDGLGGTWSVQGVGDFDADSRDDVLWRDSTDGQLVIWFAGELSAKGPLLNQDRKVVGVGDLNRDRHADIVQRPKDNSKPVYIWSMNGAARDGNEAQYQAGDGDWHIKGAIRD